MKQTLTVLTLAVAASAHVASLQATPSSGDIGKLPRTRTLDALVVRGAPQPLAPSTTTGSRLALPPLQSPASLYSIDAAAMQTRGLHTVDKAAESLPGVSTGGSPSNPSSYSMRGFTDTQVTILHNGLYLGPSNMTNRPQATFNLQSVEVLKGPASVIHGQGAIGGAVNVINKVPSFGPARYEAMIGIAGFAGRQWGIGAGGGLGDTLAYRADVSRLSTDGYVRGGGASALNATFSLLWQPREDFSAQLSVDYANDKPSTYYGAPLLPAAHARRPLSGLLSTPKDETVDAAMRFNNYNVADADVASHHIWPQLQLKWNLAEGVTLRNLGYYFRASRRWLNAESYRYDPGSGHIARDRFFVFHEQRLWGNQTSVTVQRPLGGLRHRWVAGIDYSRLDFVRDRGFPAGDSVDAYAPGPSGSFGERVGRSSPTAWRNLAVFMEDALDLTDRLKLVTGARYEQLDLDRRNYAPDGSFQAATSFARRYRPANARLGLVYALSPQLMSYVSFNTGSDPVGANIFVVNANEDFGLSRSRQVEAGLKFATPDERFGGTLALYGIRRENLLTATRQGALRNIGAQTSRGLELSVDAQPTPHWHLGANYAYTDARYETFIDSNSLLDASGNRPANVPRSVLNAWSRVHAIGGLPLEAGLGLRHVGSRYGNTANTLKLASYLLASASLSYRLADAVTLSLHGDNLTNETYVKWADIYNPGQVILGEPRNFTLRLHATF